MKQWIRLIGDVHGKFEPYKKLVKEAERSIQVGDLGVGFFKRHRGTGDMVPDTNPPYDAMVQYKARFIRGNHDNPSVCRRHSQWIKDGSIEQIGESKVMFIGGAWSIDREWRTPNVDWWEEEQCSIAELNSFVDIYTREKPDVVIAHDCPDPIAQLYLTGAHKPRITTRTDQALTAMFELHKPKLFVFGHWHLPLDIMHEGTRFICLPELAYIDLEL